MNVRIKLTLLLLIPTFGYLHPMQKKTPTEKLIETTYKDVSGFGIPEQESQLIKDKGSAPTYGEATYQAIQTLISGLNIGPQDIFYDLGSGTGKVILQVALDTKAQKVVGIELSKTRHDMAQKALSSLREKKLIDPNRVLFLQTSFTDYPFDDATIVFMCSTCFSEDLMQQITDKCARLKPGAHVITLKDLPKDDRFILQKTFELPMTWSESTKVHWYTRK